jgi:phosphatidylinositol 4-kinase
VIVKSGDDCRQELMAVQIVSKLQAVFSDAGLPLWLRPFEVRTIAATAPGAPLSVLIQVLITTSHAALIEVITDAPSIHALKSRLPRGSSLRDYFKQHYGVHLIPHRRCVWVS